MSSLKRHGYISEYWRDWYCSFSLSEPPVSSPCIGSTGCSSLGNSSSWPASSVEIHCEDGSQIDGFHAVIQAWLTVQISTNLLRSLCTLRCTFLSSSTLGVLLFSYSQSSIKKSSAASFCENLRVDLSLFRTEQSFISLLVTAAANSSRVFELSYAMVVNAIGFLGSFLERRLHERSSDLTQEKRSCLYPL